MAGEEGSFQLGAAAGQLGLPVDCSTKTEAESAIAPQVAAAVAVAVGGDVVSRGKPLLTQATVDWILAHKREPFSGLSKTDLLNAVEPQELVDSIRQTMLEAAEFHEGVEDEVAALQERLRSEVDTRGYIELDDEDDSEERVADINAISSAAFLETFGCRGPPSDYSDLEEYYDEDELAAMRRVGAEIVQKSDPEEL